MAIQYGRGNTTHAAKTKVAVAALAGLVVALGIGGLLSWKVAPLAGWDMAAIIYVIWTWQTIWPLNGEVTAAHAVREDPSRGAADSVVLVAGLASLLAVGVLLAAGSSAGEPGRISLAGLGVVSVVVGWIVVHTLFTLRYAELFYTDTPGGVDFGGTQQPSYKDFAYLAFTLGMTFQVSDTGFNDTTFRTTALRHALISYLFGTIIVATTINLIAGLTK